MTAFDYQASAATAERLLQRFGKVRTWRQIEKAPPDPDRPWRNENETTDHNVTVAIVPIKRIGFETLAQGQNEQKRGHRMALMGPQAFTPKGTDVLIVDGVQHRIANITEVNPAGVVVLYKIELQS